MKQTIQNLAKAFVGESQARNRYTFYAKVAKKEGYEQIADIFLATADQERAHALELFEMIDELKKKSKENLDEIKVDSSTPTTFGTTLDNLRAAIAGENHEYIKMYPEFAKVAEKEGHKDIAKKLSSIAVAEQHHEERYKKLLKELQNKTIFKKKENIYWVCRECGYMHFGREPPVKCPVCDNPKGFYQVKCEVY